MENFKNFFGLDIGTGNLGYAVTNEDYEVVKVGQKNALGILTYDEAQTAETRRGFRTSRRRLNRRKYRLVLLQELFNDEMMKKDKNFFQRLNENDLFLEDKTVPEKYSLFNDKNFNDKQYYNRYPTIYHLRSELIKNGTDDIRLLYLAIHHIVKYRGHFLIDGGIEKIDEVKPLFENLNEAIKSRQDNLEDYASDDSEELGKINVIEEFDLQNLDKLVEVFSNKTMARKDKIAKTCELLNCKTKNQKNLVNAVFGYTVNPTTMFGADMYEKDLIKSFTFNDDFEVIAPLVDANLTEDDAQIIFSLKSIFDFQMLKNLLGKNAFLSDAMIEIFEQHKQDLKDLKKLFEDDKKAYEFMFGVPYSDVKKKTIDKNRCNYTYYIGGGRIGENKVGTNGRLQATCTQEDFYKYVKKTIETAKIDECNIELKESILNKIENGDFMPKIVSKNNSRLPYQLNMIELEQILKNAIESGKFDFLNKVDGNESVAEKIKMLLKFRIPYYVGPVKYYADEKSRSQFAWACRKAEGRITPWNFAEKIDEEKSNEEFIKRMTSNCTYLKFANALPKRSISFEKFVALNELNKLKINDEPLSVELKQNIFNEIYLKRKANVKNVKNYLISIGYDKNLKLSGFDEQLNGDMATYRQFESVLHEKTNAIIDEIDKMVFYMTIHNDAKMIESALKKEFCDKGILTEDEAKKLKGFKYSGWASLSKELLQGSHTENGISLTDEFGERLDILDLMFSTNKNFMEIINDEKFGFAKELEQYNLNNGVLDNEMVTYETIKELYCSPSVKRCVWQTFELVKDLVKETGIPKKVFIEVTRRADEKPQKTLSRKAKLQALFKEAGKKASEKEKEMLAHSNSELENSDSSKLNSEKMFLYFMQLGRCAYSGEPIDLDCLQDYDVDHIIPQAKLKDDSIHNNKVLVKGVLNKEKADQYPLPESMRKNGIALWNSLKKLKLMNDEKFARLTRTFDFSIAEQDKFINRQLVETNQTAKIVAEILKQHFKNISSQNVEIVMSKACNVSDFRKEYELTKSRDVNDFHHACDAYLNIVVGNVLNEHFNHNREFEKMQKTESKNRTLNFKKVFDNEVWSDRDRKIIFYPKYSKNATLNLIKNELSTTNFNVTKKLVTGKGELYKATIFQGVENEGGVLYPRQESKIVDGKEMCPKSDASKYGGFKTSGTAYFIVVDSEDKKGNLKRSIEAMPIFYDKKIATGKMTMQEFMNDVLKLNNPVLAKIKGLNNSIIKIGALLDFAGCKLRLAGITGNYLTLHNANQFYANEWLNDYVKTLAIFIEKMGKAMKLSGIKDKKEMQVFVDEKAKELLDDMKRRSQDVQNKNKKIYVVTNENNNIVYDLFIDKLSKQPYSKIPTYSSLLEILKKSKENFGEKNEFAQAQLLLNIICAFQCNPKVVDVSELSYTEEKNGKILEKKGGTRQCSIVLNQDITDKNISLVTQSKSGLREKTIKLS